MKRIVLLGFAAACGSSSGSHSDAQIHDGVVDTHLIDAPPVDVPEGVGGEYRYVINHLTWPTNTTEARADGFDLDTNGQVDNQLGMVLAQFQAQGFDVQGPTDKAVAQGTTITLADLQATSLVDATGATFTLFVGQNPMPTPCNGSGDTVCGRHLTGTGSFTAATTPRDTPIDGTVASSVFTGGPGHLTVPLFVLTTSPISITLLAAHAKLTPSVGGLMRGTIGGAVSQSDIQTKIYPAMQQSFTATIMRDCTMLSNPPGCGCISGSQGATLVSYFDANHNCAITTSEIQNNSLIQSLFAPDVTVENQQALSVGFAFTAIDAAFMP